MYADQVTDSMRAAIGETNRRRRQMQLAYNAEHGIDPQTIRKEVTDILDMLRCARATERRGRGRREQRGAPSSARPRARPPHATSSGG